MQKLIIQVQRETMGGVLRARVEKDLESFYKEAAAVLRMDAADLVRPVLRESVEKVMNQHDKLKQNQRLLELANALR